LLLNVALADGSTTTSIAVVRAVRAHAARALNLISKRKDQMKESMRRRPHSRRGFMTQLAGATLVLGFAPGRGGWVTAAAKGPDTTFDKLPPLTGTLHLDETSLDAAAQDFGGLVRRRPIAVLKPGSVRDISRMVRFAARHGLRLAVRGHGHAVYGQTQIEGGIVVDMSTLTGVHVSHGRAIAYAGSSWLSVLESTLQKGLTPPVLTDYLGLSVGGTLSIGGVSPTTHRYGAQVDLVRSLQVVTGEGDIVLCSEERHRDLFHAALAGQGQCAIITRAEIRLEPSPASVRRFSLMYADIATALEDATRLVEEQRFDGVVIVVVPAAGGQPLHFLNATKYYSSPDEPDHGSLLADLRHVPNGVQIQDSSYFQYSTSVVGPFPPVNPALALMAPASGAPRFIEDALARLRPDDLGAFGVVQAFVWPRSRFTRPLFRVAEEDMVVGVGVLRSSSDPVALERMVAGNRALYEEARAIGGALYPFSALKLTRDDWRLHYGSEWRALARAKRRYDPDNVLASGPDLFGKP
jgi:cytokinin dehydrogenase